MKGKIDQLYLKTGHGQPMQRVDEVMAEAGLGLVGDLNYGVKKRQVLLVERETLEAFDLLPGQIRENITVSGIQLAGLPPGTMLEVGQALLEITGDCAPCEFIEDIRPGLRQAISGQRGTLCRVVDGGTLRVQDPVRTIQPEA
jgi:MOSC domain-containing protein YiiM